MRGDDTVPATRKDPTVPHAPVLVCSSGGCSLDGGLCGQLLPGQRKELASQHQGGSSPVAPMLLQPCAGQHLAARTSSTKDRQGGPPWPSPVLPGLAWPHTEDCVASEGGWRPRLRLGILTRSRGPREERLGPRTGGRSRVEKGTGLVNTGWSQSGGPGQDQQAARHHWAVCVEGSRGPGGRACVQEAGQDGPTTGRGMQGPRESLVSLPPGQPPAALLLWVTMNVTKKTRQGTPTADPPV